MQNTLLAEGPLDQKGKSQQLSNAASQLLACCSFVLLHVCIVFIYLYISSTSVASRQMRNVTERRVTHIFPAGSAGGNWTGLDL